MVFISLIADGKKINKKSSPAKMLYIVVRNAAYSFVNFRCRILYKLNKNAAARSQIIPILSENIPLAIVNTITPKNSTIIAKY